MSKFKVGDKVTGTNSYQKMYGIEDTIAEIKNGSCGTRYRLKNFGDSWWWEEELKLVEAKTEFTFEEVISRIKEGEVYEGIGIYNTKKISKSKVYGLEIRFNLSADYILPSAHKYRLVQQKNNYLLFEVEHQEGGKRYLFRSDCNYNLGDIVICQTSLGKSYGKIVYKVIKELTEEEFKAYKPIIKSV